MKINLSSTRLAFFLISLLALFIILATIIPQKNIAVAQIVDLKEKLGESYIIIEILKLDEIYTTPYFFIVLGMLALNIFLGNIKRIRAVIKAEKMLVKIRHFGSILFHFSLILIMLGVILNYLYRFEGVHAITEGQTVSDNENSYAQISKGLLYKDNFDRFKLKLNKVDIDYPFENTTTTGIDLSLYYPFSETEFRIVLSTNHPYKSNNLEFHYKLTNGFSPEIDIKDSAGVSLFKSFVRVAHSTSKGVSKHYDFLMIEELNLKIEIEILPDSVSFDSTLLKLKVENYSEIVYEDIIKVNEVIEFGEYQLSFPQLRRWCYISVSRNPFLNLVFLGFWLTLTGMMIGLIGRTFNNFGGKG